MHPIVPLSDFSWINLAKISLFPGTISIHWKLCIDLQFTERTECSASAKVHKSESALTASSLSAMELSGNERACSFLDLCTFHSGKIMQAFVRVEGSTKTLISGAHPSRIIHLVRKQDLIPFNLSWLSETRWEPIVARSVGVSKKTSFDLCYDSSQYKLVSKNKL